MATARYLAHKIQIFSKQKIDPSLLLCIVYISPSLSLCSSPLLKGIRLLHCIGINYKSSAELSSISAEEGQKLVIQTKIIKIARNAQSARSLQTPLWALWCHSQALARGGEDGHQ
jgi:hypothetical protein